MNSRMFAITLFTALAITVQVPAHAGDIHFTPLNDPNEGPGGTVSNGINDLGVVGGNYAGANGVYYGWVSTPPYSNKSFTTVEAAGSPQLTSVWGINLEGAVTGYTIDASNVYHGFVSHAPYTTVTTFDAPGACSSDSNPACSGNGTFGFGYGTQPYSINLEGVIAGFYADATGINHGFVTHPPYTKTTFTTIDAPGACSSGAACAGLGTVMTYFALNDLGVITGRFVDASGVYHGFVSSPPYTRFTTIDAPGPCSSDVPAQACAGLGTGSQSINLFGVITGLYAGADGVPHGFVSYPPYSKTTFTSFDPTGSTDTEPSSINLEGVVTGYFYDASNVVHGFVSRPPYTTVTTFDAPGACYSDVPACAFNGTFPYGINVEGAFTGFATDAAGNSHGFVAHQ